MSTFPNVKITLKEGNTKEIAAMIKEGSIDVGFVKGLCRVLRLLKKR